MKLTEFNLINRSKHYDAIQINDNLQVEETVVDGTDLRYYVVKNFLKNPEAFVELLKKHNAYGGDIEVSTPGYRQLISPLELSTLSNWYSNFYGNFVKKKIPITSWCYATNIYHNQMKCWNHNNRPHFDFQPITTYLWLTKDVNAGTAFYKLKFDNNTHFRYNDDIDDMKKTNKEEYRKYFKYDLTTAKEEQWYRFESDEYWQVYAVTPSEYNSVVFYDPLFFHNAFYDKSDAEVRYSLLSFLDQPVSKQPFWMTK
jgi:hypothetical protein